jgi:hypothetical protein
MPEFTDSPALGPPRETLSERDLRPSGCKLPRDRSAPHQGDQRFESPSLQRGVRCEPDFLRLRGRPAPLGRALTQWRSASPWPSSTHVSVETRDSTEFLIPNEDIITHQVVNWSHKSDRVRLKVPVRVPHDSDLDQALALMREAASYPERVLAVPAPNALIMAFGETAIELELRFWIKDAQNGVHNVKSQVLYEIWRLFRQEGIQIPYPKRDLYVRSDLRT